MNRSFSKRRYLSEANERLENRFLKSKKIIKESGEVMPDFDSTEIISLTQDILKQSGAQFNIGDYVSVGDNPMCVPDNDTDGILSKIFDFFNNGKIFFSLLYVNFPNFKTINIPKVKKRRGQAGA